MSVHPVMLSYYKYKPETSRKPGLLAVRTGTFVMSQQLRRSALRGSALQRLGFVVAPISVLWLFVAFALDAFA